MNAHPALPKERVVRHHRGMPRHATSVNDIPLVRDSWTSGVVFELDRPAHRDVDIEFDGGWSLELMSGHKTCVVRGSDLKGFRPVFGAASAAAVRGLDLLCAHDGPAHAIARWADDHLVFWPTGKDRLQICWASTYRFGFTMRAEARVVRANGTEVVRSERPWIHHVSYTHFRQSQLESDLPDSYRHAYLALEALLDSVLPQGSANEGEWVAAALESADKIVPLPPSSQKGESASAQAKRRWYEEERLRLFHAKPSRAKAINPEAVDYDALLTKKQELLGYYVNLARSVLHLRRGGGMMTKVAFEMSVLERYENAAPVVVALGDGIPAERGEDSKVIREPHGTKPTGEGVFYCRRVALPDGRRVRRWEFRIPTDLAAYVELEQGVLYLDERDALSTRLRLALGSGDYRQRFDT